ncbi:TetR/AcrR family transcriptional regulator [Pseudomonas savastanoi pv. phaseolicola]|uniref:Uncharacterized protein n=1 Tax=Pseudomonas coronafaciens pv. coronafaciens TaxID=235275 RepID=A0AAE6QJQ4_9PSED|nr:MULTISPECIES: TetR/AcrR family transcriptional regulator [Pseudomonas syringae group]MBN3471261.1 TetR/AcrR family transcriptional regulator [Pseudomonas savastanoi pv. phaseolicola]MBN3478262.1 TetR/AcrR family transcriptional regulator [Pseudomonas savastanoi pv. phaseolicola]QGT82808.1 hypothetical protein GMO17_17355 [Pseudomonas coronafaciens pv. coronafaciens]RMO22146.1 hypothetical protein ALQ46_03330 [Pseudomonas savastanoi pv. phaseolicola]
MTQQDTRTRLVELIKEHQLQFGLKKLPVGKLADRAGISRQSFNRFYKDLKPYSEGQSIAELLADDPEASRSFLTQRDREADQLRNEIEDLKRRHAKELEKALAQHITSLMNNDILAFEANEMSALLASQSQHNELLQKKLTALELRQTRYQMDEAESQLASGYVSKSTKNFLTFDVDLSKANNAYINSQSFDDYEDIKEKAIDAMIESIIKLPDHSKIQAVIYMDRFLYPFSKFCESIPPKQDKLTVCLRLPVFSQAEVGIVLSKLSKMDSISLHVPYSTSEAITAANRKFMHRNVPEDEFADADKARPPLITWGVDEVRVFKVK